jgi:hypothetical protein
MVMSELIETISKKHIELFVRYVIVEVMCDSSETGDDIEVPSCRVEVR